MSVSPGASPSGGTGQQQGQLQFSAPCRPTLRLTVEMRQHGPTAGNTPTAIDTATAGNAASLVDAPTAGNATTAGNAASPVDARTAFDTATVVKVPAAVNTATAVHAPTAGGAASRDDTATALGTSSHVDAPTEGAGALPVDAPLANGAASPVDAPTSGSAVSRVDAPTAAGAESVAPKKSAGTVIYCYRYKGNAFVLERTEGWECAICQMHCRNFLGLQQHIRASHDLVKCTASPEEPEEERCIMVDPPDHLFNHFGQFEALGAFGEKLQEGAATNIIMRVPQRHRKWRVEQQPDTETGAEYLGGLAVQDLNQTSGIVDAVRRAFHGQFIPDIRRPSLRSHASPTTASLDEASPLLQSADVPRIFHAASHQPWNPRELQRALQSAHEVPDSDDDADVLEWRVALQRRLNKHAKLTPVERQFMAAWNTYIAEHPVVADAQIPNLCFQFAVNLAATSPSLEMRRCFTLHLLNLVEYALLTPDEVDHCHMRLDLPVDTPLEPLGVRPGSRGYIPPLRARISANGELERPRTADGEAGQKRPGSGTALHGPGAKRQRVEERPLGVSGEGERARPREDSFERQRMDEGAPGEGERGHREGHMENHAPACGIHSPFTGEGRGEPCSAAGHSKREPSPLQAERGSVPGRGESRRDSGNGEDSKGIGVTSAEGLGELTRCAGRGRLPDMHGRGELPDAQGREELPDAQGRGELPNARGRGELPNAQGRGELPDAQGRGDLPVAQGRGELQGTQGGGESQAAEARQEPDTAQSRRDLPISEQGQGPVGAEGRGEMCIEQGLECLSDLHRERQDGDRVAMKKPPPIPQCGSRGPSLARNPRSRGVSPLNGRTSRGVSPLGGSRSRGASPLHGSHSRGGSPLNGSHPHGLPPLNGSRSRGVSPAACSLEPRLRNGRGRQKCSERPRLGRLGMPKRSGSVNLRRRLPSEEDGGELGSVSPGGRASRPLSVSSDSESLPPPSTNLIARKALGDDVRPPRPDLNPKTLEPVEVARPTPATDPLPGSASTSGPTHVGGLSSNGRTHVGGLSSNGPTHMEGWSSAGPAPLGKVSSNGPSHAGGFSGECAERMRSGDGNGEPHTGEGIKVKQDDSVSKSSAKSTGGVAGTRTPNRGTEHDSALGNTEGPTNVCRVEEEVIASTPSPDPPSRRASVSGQAGAASTAELNAQRRAAPVEVIDLCDSEDEDDNGQYTPPAPGGCTASEAKPSLPTDRKGDARVANGSDLPCSSEPPASQCARQEAHGDAAPLRTGGKAWRSSLTSPAQVDCRGPGNGGGGLASLLTHRLTQTLPTRSASHFRGKLSKTRIMRDSPRPEGSKRELFASRPSPGARSTPGWKLALGRAPTASSGARSCADRHASAPGSRGSLPDSLGEGPEGRVGAPESAKPRHAELAETLQGTQGSPVTAGAS